MDSLLTCLFDVALEHCCWKCTTDFSRHTKQGIALGGQCRNVILFFCLYWKATCPLMLCSCVRLMSFRFYGCENLCSFCNLCRINPFLVRSFSPRIPQNPLGLRLDFLPFNKKSRRIFTVMNVFMFFKGNHRMLAKVSEKF